MKNLTFIVLFIIGVGVAILGTHFARDDSGNEAANVRTAGDYCTMACCLPYQGELSDLQQETLMSLERNYCRCRDRLSREIDKKRLALADILLQGKPDMTAIDRLLKETGSLQAELERETIKHILDIKAQLAPQDQERFVKPIAAEIRRRCFHQAQDCGRSD